MSASLETGRSGLPEIRPSETAPRVRLDHTPIGITAERIRPSVIRNLEPLATEARLRGIKVGNLHLGAPGVPPSEKLLYGLQTVAADPRFARYGESQGERRLRVPIAEKIRQDHGVKELTEENVLLTHGSSEAIDMAFKAILDPGDAVVLFEPFYANYATLAYANKGEVIAVPTSMEEGFHLPTYEKIKEEIMKAKAANPDIKRIRAIIANSPGNPTGVVYTEKDWAEILKLATDPDFRHEALLVSDEAYAGLVYGNNRFISVLDVVQDGSPGFVMLRTFSKEYAVPGWRIGYAVSYDKPVFQKMLFQAQARGSVNNPAQHALIHMLDIDPSYFSQNAALYESTGNLLYETLQNMPGVKVPPFSPEGAFYLAPELAVDSAENFARWMLTGFIAPGTNQNESVVLVPFVGDGQGFYQTWEAGHTKSRLIRIPFADQAAIEFSLPVIARALERYPGRLDDAVLRKPKKAEVFPGHQVVI